MHIVSVKNVRLFDSSQTTESSTITFHASPGNIMSEEELEDREEPPDIIDGAGCTLLPALIDSNVNIAAAELSLQKFASYGIGTVLDMSSSSAENQAMRFEAKEDLGLPSYLACGTVVAVRDSDEVRRFPLRETRDIRDPDDVDAFVAHLVDGPNKASYVKVVADTPGISDAVLAAVVTAAHRRGLLAIAHASQVEGYRRVVRLGYDIITHVPLDGELEPEVAQALARRGGACVPSLCVLQAMAAAQDRREDKAGSAEAYPIDFDRALRAVKVLHTAGVRICAGTEANTLHEAPIAIGESLHRELELLCRAGLSNAEVLHSATWVPATVFGLDDRGILQTGRRADLILVEGNPLEDISATRRLKRVWIKGLEVDNPRSS